MNTRLIFALLAIICFILSYVDGRATALGLIFLTVALCVA